MANNFQPVQLTTEKAERLVSVIERIISRHTGRQLEIKSYRIVPNEIETAPKKIS